MSIRVIQGDCRDVLATLPADSMHCVVTSPPYWGLRDYGVPPTVWGGDAKCEHVWGEEAPIIVGRGDTDRETPGGRGGSFQGGPRHSTSGAFCHCGAWRGSHGLEPTIDLYVRNAVEIFRAVHRVLRPDGTLWLNLGDSYGGMKGDTRGAALYRGKGRDFADASGGACFAGTQAKQLMGAPWRVAFALQADGWWLRQDIIWAKPNPMPESVTDRCTKAHEYLFLLTKSARYYFDAEAIKEASIWSDDNRAGNGRLTYDGKRQGAAGTGQEAFVSIESTRNKRSVWTVATCPFPEAHFATFPPALIEPCIKAGTSEKGCCAKCGAPWERITDESKAKSEREACGKALTSPRHDGNSWNENDGRGFMPVSSQTLGWRPTCKCAAAVVPATILDPFGGAGTTGLVADRLRRDAVLIELNPTYAEMARRRITNDAPLFALAAE